MIIVEFNRWEGLVATWTPIHHRKNGCCPSGATAHVVCVLPCAIKYSLLFTLVQFLLYFNHNLFVILKIMLMSMTILSVKHKQGIQEVFLLVFNHIGVCPRVRFFAFFFYSFSNLHILVSRKLY